jgi:ribonucleoside-diphosphate reductase alpha chain
MQVLKRDNTLENVDFNKITRRIKKLCCEIKSTVIDPILIAQKVCAAIHNKVKTTELDNLASEISMSLSTQHLDYGTLAAYIVCSDMHKNNSLNFLEITQKLFDNGYLSQENLDITKKHKDVILKSLNYKNDYLFDYFGLKTLQKGYLQKVGNKIVENPQDMFMRVSIGIHGDDIDSIIETYNLLSDKYFTHATPTLFNSGSKFPQLASCFLMAMQDDSIDGIYDTLKDCAKISKWAGGIGMHIHNIRSSGATINNVTNVGQGIVPMLKVFNDTAKYINQNGKRPGSIAVYLQVDHPDILDFLEMKKNSGDEEVRARDLFYAVWIPDLFMKKIKNNEDWCLFCPYTCPGLASVYGEEYEVLYNKYEQDNKFIKKIKAVELWTEICKSQIETGNPYMLYKDAANNKSNQKNVGTIKSSNLCVAPNTMILTENGYFPIKDLKDQDIKVWNGTKFSDTIVRKTGENQKLLTIKTNNGMDLKCTEYHKFHIETSSRLAVKSRVKVIDAKDLKLGMNIIRYNLPVLQNNTNELKYAYTHGLFCADGTYAKVKNYDYTQCEFDAKDNNLCNSHQKNPILYLYNEKQKLVKYIDFINNITNHSNRLNIQLPKDIETKYKVPINYSIKSKLLWLAGVCDGDGCIVKNNGSINIQISSVYKAFLIDVFYLLQTLGINCNVTLSQSNHQMNLPNGKCGLSEYKCYDIYMLNIDSKSIVQLCSLGFSPKRLVISLNKISHHITNRFIKITGIVDENEYDDTYCFNEPIEHKGIFNGLLTGNCTEILEYSDKDECAVCNLASICLPQFVDKEKNVFNFEKLHAIVQVITKNLNKVIDRSFYPIEKAKYSNFRHRPIGIGVQGLADVYMMLKYPFDSKEAKDLNKKIFETMYHSSVTASCNLAIKDGCYESYNGSPISKGIFQFDMWDNGYDMLSGMYDWDKLRNQVMKHGVRNSLLIAPMPTATTSQIMGNNEAFEPYTSNIYLRRTLAGEFVVTNKHLMKDLLNIDMWNEKMKNTLIYNNGSIQDIPDIPKELKNIYKTSWELSQKALIDQAADRGVFVCQSQSMNLFVKQPSIKILSSMHFYTWSKGLKTGIYYLRTKPAADPIKITVDQNSCENCSG